MFKVKIFRGSHASTKIFYLEFFINEIFSVEKFPNYGVYIYIYDHGLEIIELTTKILGVTIIL